MKKIFSLIFLFLFLSKNAFALTAYSIEDIAHHNTSNDCWMVINQNVYDLTKYLVNHDNKLDIRPWCGKDATQDYLDKNGRGQSHSSKADEMLKNYQIGQLENKLDTNTINKMQSPFIYNFFLPFFGTIIIYFLSMKLTPKNIHSFIWNTVMLLGLIPSFGFGSLMVLAKQFNWAIPKSNILFSHVELSIIFGTVCIFHFIYRIKIYFAQGKVLKNSL
jgi:hypothetical protein